MNNRTNMECAICYGDDARCRLACRHVFCKGCVKTWYLKGAAESHSCPMCRRPIYFKGFYKLRRQWNEESYESRTNEIFNEALAMAIDAELGRDDGSDDGFDAFLDDGTDSAADRLGGQHDGMPEFFHSHSRLLEANAAGLAAETRQLAPAPPRPLDGPVLAELLHEACDEFMDADMELRLRRLVQLFEWRSSRGALHLSDLRDIEETYRFLKHEDAHPDEIDFVLAETDEYFSSRRLSSKKQGRERPRTLPQPKLINKAPKHKRKAAGSRGRIGVRLGR